MTRTYSYAALRITLALCGGIAGVGAGALLMGVVEETSYENAGLAVLVALVAWGVWRGATVRVVADAKGLVVRNMSRTHRVAWSDVVEVTWREPLFWRLTLRGGREMPCPCLVVRGRRAVMLVAMSDLGDHRYKDVVKAWQRGRR